MQIRIANPTKKGGDVQLWPMEWQAILAVLPPGNPRTHALTRDVRAQVQPGTTTPVRITLANADIEILREAMARLA